MTEAKKERRLIRCVLRSWSWDHLAIMELELSDFVSDFEFRISDLPQVVVSKPSISLKTWSSWNRFWRIEPDGQAATQVPQPLQSASLITAFFFPSS
jgi:hypothetical protein